MRTPLSKRDIEAFIPSEARATPPDSQSLPEEIAKYIPGEVVSFYIPVLAALASYRMLAYGTDPPGIGFTVLLWAAFVIGLLGTFYYMHMTTKKELENGSIYGANEKAIAKAAISSVGFIVWAITLGSPWDFIKYYEAIGPVLILFFVITSKPTYDIIASVLKPPPKT